MVLYTDFNLFLQASHSLYLSAPDRTRYSMKFRHSDAELVLRVTDDRQNFQFRTSAQSDLKQIERFNAIFTKLMTAEDPTTVDTKAEEKKSNEPKKQSKKKK